MFKKILQITTLFAAGALLTAQAATLSFSPSAQTIDVGDTTSVDINISDYGSFLSAYDLSISFDDAILGLTAESINTSDFDSGFSFLSPDTTLSVTGGVIDFSLLSWDFDSDLASIQGGVQLTLATLSFEGLAAGISSLDFTHLDITSGVSSPLAGGVGNITVATVAAVPEPSAMILLAMGAVGFSVANRKKAV